ncbi:S8 family serine peptidase [Duganella radicis]|uniref:S8 family serine peptidase n=1 Tax=Duganella radicis TaxID=551988 RepID=A0A6L6PIA7_9BURK|nr:S8 family serine peptidase [Duganella radicis]MTV38281.1 S8 family serine peptidase [Duganella radicis]
MATKQVLLATMTLLATAGPVHADELRRSYIVQLADQPLAAYSGNLAGLRATKASPGQRLELAGNDATRYRSYLGTQQAQLAALLPATAITHQYQVVFNGFAAHLTDAEVRTLKASGKTLRITPDQRQHPVTNYTPTFLGLDQPGGLWDQLGGQVHAGEDVIVGVIDTGVWPENLSYADRVDDAGQPTFASSGTPAYGPPPARWHGVCQTGEGFNAAHCNNKLIGARYFDQGFRAGGAPIHWSEFRSPRDSLSRPAGEGGHGTHTSSTAAGNRNVPAQASNGELLGRRSGIAPRARLAVYKICWSFNVGGSSPSGIDNTCYSSDSLAAIEAAVSDGVDVLNYSIGGGSSPLDPVAQAFRHAAEAGVFIAAAAGNDGPGNTVSHISPWLATVAATSHDKTYRASVTLGDGRQFSGDSLGVTPLPRTALVRGEDAVAAGADISRAAHCLRREDVYDAVHPIAQLDPAKVAGKIVACQRGDNALSAKAAAVAAAGGVGMIVLDDGNGPMLDIYPLPTIHVSQADGALIDAYAATAGATAALSASALTPMTGPVLADFSSRGPNQFDPGVLKPDLGAPGVGILAGISPSLDSAQHAP